MEQLFQSMPDIIQGLVGLVQMLLDSAQGNLWDLHVQEQTGWGVLSEHVINLNDKLKTVGIASADTLMGAAKALGAIFALIVAAQKAYKMMTLDGKFEVLEIMRPVLFALVIANSGVIVEMVTAPGEALESHFREVYNDKCYTVKNLREQRSSFAGAFRNMISEKTNAAEEVEKSFVENAIDGAVDLWNKVTNIGTTVESLLFAKIFGWVDEALVFIGVSAVVGALAGTFTAACTGGDLTEGTLEGAVLSTIAAAATIFIPILLPSASAATIVSATFATAGVAGFGIDILTQHISHEFSDNASEPFQVDWGRSVKTSITTGIAGVIPTYGTPTDSLINTVGSLVMGADASFINAAVEIAIVNLFP